MTAGRERVHLVVLGFLAYVALLALGVYTLALHPPRIQPAPPPPPPPRGGLYAADGTPLALTLEGKRLHPLGRSASQLLGFGERASGRGLEGLERDLNASLSEGRSYTLTLEPFVQALAERALWRGLEESRADYGSAVVMDAEGRLLAVANGPPFDPDAPRKSPEEDISWRNHAFLVPLEPGSTAKTLTAAMLLEEGAATLATRVEAPMRRELEGWTIREPVPHPPVLTLEEVLRYSSNVGISLLAERLPKETFFAYMEALGLTRADLLPGIRVAAPLFQPPEKWSRVAYANHAFGQGFLITPLHLAAAYGALVDGVYRTPVLLKGMEGRSWRVFSPATAQALREALARVAVPTAHLPGYRLGGKTGTAQVVVDGRYSQEVFTAWFAGFVPADRPRFTVVVAVHYPKTQINGSQVAAPIFREIAAGLLAWAGLPPYAEGR